MTRTRRLWTILAATLATVAAIGAVGWAGFDNAILANVPDVPSDETLWAMRRAPGIRFEDHDGQPIAVRGSVYGERVALKDLPSFVPRAFLAAEDRRFYSHGPIEARSIARALWRDLRTGRPAEGGSTIAQQLARTLFLGHEQTLRRKLEEAVLAGRLEDELGKDGVLELYLNRAYFGAGAYGVDAASRVYFAKPAAALTLGEAALLAALPNAPTRLSPNNDLAAGWARAKRVLAIMRSQGWASDAEVGAAAGPPPLAPGRPGEGDWGQVLDRAQAETLALAGDARDLVVRLTLSSRLQSEGESSLRAIVAGEGRARRMSQGALVALAPDGAIRALVGGVQPRLSGFDRATQARRQPGSAFKAFVFGAAMESGVRPGDTRQDGPVNVGDWRPENYGGRFGGRVTVAQALARSINTVSVRLTLEAGPAIVAAFARRCGMADIPANPGPSIALGAYEVTLLELASGYQVFQNGGGRQPPWMIEWVRTTGGQTLYRHDVAAPDTVTDPLYASRMVRMLEGVIASGTGRAADIGRPAAGKTGTSQHWRDAWFVGFTPDLLAAIWVGNDDNRPTAGVTGGEAPARIWRRFMLAALKDTPATDFAWLQPEPPADVEIASASTAAPAYLIPPEDRALPYPSDEPLPPMPPPPPVEDDPDRSNLSASEGEGAPMPLPTPPDATPAPPLPEPQDPRYPS
ncbi:MAG: transglycosylase domain-containing protein, partial [Caulobacteraceae bacterium]|nr:transglycosylase domain-containing protein [Caulobacteraceae bacterium]